MLPGPVVPLGSRGSGKTHALYQGTTLEAAEKCSESPEGTTESSPGCNPG
jgi:hypothetical protein